MDETTASESTGVNSSKLFKRIIDLENILLKGGYAEHVTELANLYKVKYIKYSNVSIYFQIIMNK
jgi:hypothetical protein